MAAIGHATSGPGRWWPESRKITSSDDEEKISSRTCGFWKI
ncbi:hypothetical protein HMPREF3039_03159 [Akkermansia sp. KLE1798]|nr:hypothetical protein HMPREF3039_03159 [Akkermansia sp. KLE1798]